MAANDDLLAWATLLVTGISASFIGLQAIKAAAKAKAAKLALTRSSYTYPRRWRTYYSLG